MAGITDCLRRVLLHRHQWRSVHFIHHHSVCSSVLSVCPWSVRLGAVTALCTFVSLNFCLCLFTTILRACVLSVVLFLMNAYVYANKDEATGRNTLSESKAPSKRKSRPLSGSRERGSVDMVRVDVGPEIQGSGAVVAANDPEAGPQADMLPADVAKSDA
jgi:hypothetical protein